MKRIKIILGLLTIAFPLSSCSYFLVKTSRTLRPDEKPLPVQEATKTQLIERFNEIARNMQTLQMKVDFTLTGLDQKKKSTDKELQYYITDGHILVRRPSQIRIIGLLYKITAFDMVSNDSRFEIFVPEKNKLYFGPNDQRIGKVQALSINIRPQHILQAIAMDALADEPAKDILMETEQEGRRSYYVIYIIRHQSDEASFSRKIWFDRYDLNLVRQKIYGEGIQLESDINYSNFQLLKGRPFPHDIAIKRPTDNFSLLIHVQDIKANIPLTDEQFKLTLPDHVERVDLHDSDAAAKKE
jgi:outer membrane lipoprotein-sorting protein